MVADGTGLAGVAARMRVVEGDITRLDVDAIVNAANAGLAGGGAGEADLLAGCYRNALEIAARQGLATVAFPAISTAIYGYPPEAAAPVAVRAAAEVLAREPGLREVTFCCFGAASARLHRRAVEELAVGGPGAGAAGNGSSARPSRA